MYWTVKSVEPLDNYWLFLTFENNEQRYFDMNPLLDTGVFRALKDPEMFRTVKVAFDSISWKNDIDIAPETLYHEGLINRNNNCKRILDYKGSNIWEGNLDEMRLTR